MIQTLKKRIIEPRAAGVAIFVLALGLRLLHLLDIHSLPHFRQLVLDAQEYDAMASRLLGGDWLLELERGYVHGILYPLLLAGWKWLGLGPVAIRLAQAAMGAACCWLIFRVARRCTTPAAGVVAGLLAALYWPFILFSGELLATTLVLLLELMLVDTLLTGRTAPPSSTIAPMRNVLAGVLVALLIMTRANAALVAPVVIWWIWRARGRRGWRPLAEFVVALLVTVSPYLVRNQIVQGNPMPFQGGWSFYQGANPAADGTPYVRQGSQWQRLEMMAVRAGAIEPAERGAFYLQQSLRFIGDNPAQWLNLTYRKLRLFWHDHEVPVSADLRAIEAQSHLWPALPPAMGVIVPLALVGLVLGGGLVEANRRLLAGFVLAWLVSGLLFTVSARYRLPAAPFLIVFAGSGVTALIEVVRRRRAQGGWQAAGALGVGLVVAFTGVDEEAIDHLRSEWLLAHVHIRRGDYLAAENALQAAQTRDPNSADVHNSLGVVHEHLRQPLLAEQAYRRAVVLEPDYARAWMNLGKLLLRRGKSAEGSSAVRRSLKLDPRPPAQSQGWYELGLAGLARRQHHDARAAFTRALAAAPTALAWYGKSVASAGLGMAEDQVLCLERAVALEPGLAPAQRNLGALYVRQGRYAAAERALLAAVDADQTNGLTQQHLAGLYRLTGRPDAARQALANARRLGVR